MAGGGSLGYMSIANRNKEWYDRNPISRAQFFGLNPSSPHGDTSRWVYTVPAGKQAIVETLFVMCIRLTAATAPGTVSVRCGGVGQIVEAKFYTNNVGDRAQFFAPCQVTLVAGETASCGSYDTSTGGTNDMLGTSKITEYGAG